MQRLHRRAACVLGSVLSLATAALAVDPPDSRLNPRSGLIEITDSVWSGAYYGVRHTVDRNDQPDTVTVLTAPAQGGRDPKLAIAPATGDTWVVWWRETPTGSVRWRSRIFGTNTWTDEAPISLAGEDSRHPVIAHDGAATWIAYLVHAGTNVSVAVTTGNGHDPFPTRTILWTSGYSGTLDTRIHVDGEHLWLTWIDSASDVRWSEYDRGTGTWSPPEPESYVNDNVEAARARIRARVLH